MFVTLPSDFSRRGSCKTLGRLKPDYDLEIQLGQSSPVGPYLVGFQISLNPFSKIKHIIWIFMHKWETHKL